jgi:hypothetical protein
LTPDSISANEPGARPTDWTDFNEAGGADSHHCEKRAIMSLTDELVEPAVSKFSRYQWVLSGLILGFFLGFVDTLLIATLLGYLGLKLPLWFGVPTTFTGYFFAGIIAGRLAPPDILWEPPAGVLICVLLMMLGMMGLRGHGVWFLFYFGVIPAVAVAVCYLGVRIARKKNSPVAEQQPTNNAVG